MKFVRACLGSSTTMVVVLLLTILMAGLWKVTENHNSINKYLTLGMIGAIGIALGQIAENKVFGDDR